MTKTLYFTLKIEDLYILIHHQIVYLWIYSDMKGFHSNMFSFVHSLYGVPWNIQQWHGNRMI